MFFLPVMTTASKITNTPRTIVIQLIHLWPRNYYLYIKISHMLLIY